MSITTVASVAVQNVAFHFDSLYEYIVPEDCAGADLIGCRVTVPFGRGGTLRRGVIIETRCLSEAPAELKTVFSVLDTSPLFDERMIRLAFFMKSRTFCTIYDALKTILPGLSKNTSDATVRMIRTDVTAEDFEAAVKEAEDYDKKQLKLQGISVSKKQADALDVLIQLRECSVKELCYFSGVTQQVVKTLEKKGLVHLYDKETYRRPYDEKSSDGSAIELSESQKLAFDKLLSKFHSGGGTALLYGVTGSGKTKVYMRLIDEVLKTGKGIIVMVPEISLTPQTLMLFHSRFGDKVAVFHSGLSDGERRDEWKRVRRGLAQIAVGTRSAVFAPFDDIGLVIMDEEQEHTYKSEQSPRYHARDIARYRCAESKALLVLASATPSFESFSAAMAGKYEFCLLPERYGKSVLPDVSVVDMCKERSDGNTGEISRELLAALMKNLDEGHQSIILLNRRGYNTYAACNSCGEVRMCPNCSISLTYHKDNNKLMCHYCGYTAEFSTVCDCCGADDVHYTGAGTQRFEDELSQLLPSARILRMDADSTMQKFSYEEKLGAFRSGEYDILVGTQMVAKGLDFENVTLVGVLSADRQLYDDDFRSMEVTFDLLTQVIGRAGRGSYPGRAVIQTMQPSHEAIKLATRQDFKSFYDLEINVRRAMIYPPYCSLCQISFQGEREERVVRSALNFTKELEKAVKSDYTDIKIIALGPMPERIYKVSNKYRYRLIIKCKNNKRFREMLAELLTAFGRSKENSGVSVIPDIIS